MPKFVDAKLPMAPELDDGDEIFPALGRMIVAWSASEYYLAMLSIRLVSKLDLFHDDNIAKLLRGEPVTLTADTNTIFSIFFAIESSRGRREMVRKLSETKFGEGYISVEWRDKIFSALESHGKIGRLRNRYIHTPISKSLDEKMFFLDENIAIHRDDRTRLLSNPQIRLNNNLVKIKEVNGILDSLRAWIEDARQLVINMPVKVPGGNKQP